MDLIRRHGFILALVLGWLLAAPAQAYHYPWDQGHDTFQPEEPPEAGPCEGGECEEDPDDCNTGSSPVYVATGQFKWVDRDLKLPGRPTLQITRTHQSNDPRDGLFGNGWSFGCDKLLKRISDTSDGTERIRYVLRLANGKRYFFEESEEGTITPPPGLFYDIEKHENGILRLVSRDGSYEEYAYGNLIARVDRNGNRLDYHYDSGSLIQVADQNGRHLDFAYDSRGRIRTVTDPAGRSWRYDYDLNGNLVAVTDPLGGVRRYEYRAYQPPGDGHTYYLLTRVTDESGVTEVEVTYSGNKVASYSEGSNRFSYRYDTSTNTTTKSDSLGNTWRFRYNEAGQRIEDTDPLGYKRTTLRDDNGLGIQTTDEAGQVWKSAWDSLGRRLSSTDPLGQTTTRQYQGTRPEPIRITSPSGRVTEIAYDTNGNPLTITDPAGATTRLEWNARGDLTGAVDAQGHRITVTPNALGLPERITDALGRTTILQYDGLGRLTTITNPAGETTYLTYDALGRVVSTQNAAGHTTTYRYDEAGRLLTLTDPKGQRWQFGYDAYGRQISETSPDGRTTTYSYTTDNRVQSKTRPDGTTVTYRYDAAGRLVEKDADGEVTTYAYDPRGLLIKATNEAATVTRQYDAAGQLESETVNDRTVQVARNEEGEVIQLTAAGRTLEYGRDNRGDIDQLTAQGVHGFTYDLLGQLTRTSHPNGLTSTYTYDAAGQLTGIAHTGVMSLAYSHDPSGRITRKQGNNDDWRYQYDPAERLILATGLSQSHDYQYDELGNRLDIGGQYDPANRIQQDATYDYTFDERGNLIAKVDKTTGERHEYAYNATNRLVRFERYPAGSGTPETTATYSYDPFGRRVQKTVDGVTTLFQWSGSSLIAEYDQNGSVTKRYHYATGYAPAQVEDGNGTYQVHTDHLNTPWYLTDQSGRVVWRAAYQPYGKAAVDDDPDGNRVPVVFNFRFPGQYEDLESGYYYNYFRDYDPATGRYAESDPIGLEGGLNTYAYVGNNPLNYIDPRGLNPVAGAIGGGAIAGPPGAVVGGIIGFGIGLYIGDRMFNEGADSDGPNPTAPIPDNPGDSPGEGWEWKGSGPPESGKGNWVNPETGQKIHPDLNHPDPKGPHWGLTNPDGSKWDFFPDKGKWEQCK